MHWTPVSFLALGFGLNPAIVATSRVEANFVGCRYLEYDPLVSLGCMIEAISLIILLEFDSGRTYYLFRESIFES